MAACPQLSKDDRNDSLLLQTALDKADEAQKEMQSIPEAPSLQEERISTGAHTSATDRDTSLVILLHSRALALQDVSISAGVCFLLHSFEII